MTTIKNNKSCKHETFIQNKVNLTCMQKVETQKANPYSKQYEFKQVFCNRRQSLLIKLFFFSLKRSLNGFF